MELCLLLIIFIHITGLLLELLRISFQVAAAALMAFHPFLGFASLLVTAVRTLVEDSHLVSTIGCESIKALRSFTGFDA